MTMVAKAGFYNGKFRKAGQGALETVSGEQPGAEAETDLGKMTKDELLAEAERRGVTVASSATKTEIIAALSAA